MENATQAEKIMLTVENDSDMEGKFLTFFIEKQLFALPITDVVQIVSMQAINEIPDSINYMKGVINLRGSIIPVIDVRLRLGKLEKAYDERTCIIVILINQKEIGLIVDEVDAVISITDENISQSPQIADNSSQNYLSGIAKFNSKVVLIMDASKVLSAEILTLYDSEALI
jgi:purine-binding chemotaxis protein CheW